MGTAKAARIIPILCIVLLGGCATAVNVDRPASNCSELIPSDWLKGTPGEPILGPGADIGAWQAFADAEAGDLDTANDRESKTVGIVQACEKHDAQLVAGLTKKPWWQFW